MSSGEIDPEYINVAEDRPGPSQELWDRYGRTFRLIDPHSYTAEVIVQLAQARDEANRDLSQAYDIKNMVKTCDDFVEPYQTASNYHQVRYDTMVQIYRLMENDGDNKGERLPDTDEDIDRICLNKKLEINKNGRWKPHQKMDLLRLVNTIGSSFKFDLYLKEHEHHDSADSNQKVWRELQLYQTMPRVEPNDSFGSFVVSVALDTVDKGLSLKDAVRKVDNGEATEEEVELGELDQSAILAASRMHELTNLYGAVEDLQYANDQLEAESGTAPYSEEEAIERGCEIIIDLIKSNDSLSSNERFALIDTVNAGGVALRLDAIARSFDRNQPSI